MGKSLLTTGETDLLLEVVTYPTCSFCVRNTEFFDWCSVHDYGLVALWDMMIGYSSSGNPWCKLGESPHWRTAITIQPTQWLKLERLTYQILVSMYSNWKCRILLTRMYNGITTLENWKFLVYFNIYTMLGLSIVCVSTPRFRPLRKEYTVPLLIIIKNCKQPKSRIVNSGGIFTQWNTNQCNGKHFPDSFKKCGGIPKARCWVKEMMQRVIALWIHLRDI